MSAITTRKLVGFSRDSEGNVAPMFALMLVPLMASVGLAIDFARSTETKTDMQSALDAAAIAALQAGPAGAEAAGNAMFNANFNASLTTAPVLNFTFVAGGGMRATARGSIDATFATAIGLQTFELAVTSLIEPSRTVTETSTGEIVIAGNIPCVHVMDQSNQYAFDLQGNENIDASTCDARVRSNRSTAMREEGGENIKFKRIDVKGQASVTEGLQIVSTPYQVSEDAAVVGNPYESSIRDVAQVLTVSNCTNANTGKSWVGNVSPGTYCGSTEFKNATFAPGVYIIKSSTGNKTGALTLSGDLDGSAGVTFYFSDNKSKLASYAGSGNTVLKAPTTGTTRGILFFEGNNRGNAWDVVISTYHHHTWQGLIYLPSANLTMNGMNEFPMFNVAISANTLVIENWDNMVWEAYAWTPFNQSSPIRYGDETEETEISTTTDKPLYVRE